MTHHIRAKDFRVRVFAKLVNDLTGAAEYRSGLHIIEQQAHRNLHFRVSSRALLRAFNVECPMSCRTAMCVIPHVSREFENRLRWRAQRAGDSSLFSPTRFADWHRREASEKPDHMARANTPRDFAAWARVCFGIQTKTHRVCNWNGTRCDSKPAPTCSGSVLYIKRRHAVAPFIAQAPWPPRAADEGSENKRGSARDKHEGDENKQNV